MQGQLAHQDVINKVATLFENHFRERPNLTVSGDVNLDTVVAEIPKEFLPIAEKVIATMERERQVMSRWQLNAAFTIAAKSLPRAPATPAKQKAKVAA